MAFPTCFVAAARTACFAIMWHSAVHMHGAVCMHGACVPDGCRRCVCPAWPPALQRVQNEAACCRPSWPAACLHVLLQRHAWMHSCMQEGEGRGQRQGQQADSHSTRLSGQRKHAHQRLQSALHPVACLRLDPRAHLTRRGVLAWPCATCYACDGMMLRPPCT